MRRPDDGSRPEIPAMTLRSHSRGGRSSACAQEPSSQAGSYPTGNESLGVHSTRQEKSGPEPEIHPSHTNDPTDPTSVGTGLNPPPLETIPTTTQPPQVYTGPQEPVDTGHSKAPTGTTKAFTGSHTGYDLVGGSNTTSGPTQTGNTTDGATGIHSVSNTDARNAHNLYALAHAAESVAAIHTCLPSHRRITSCMGVLL